MHTLKSTIKDYPKSLDNLSIRAARLAMLKEAHVLPLTRFVETIRKEKGAEYQVPYFDPLDGGIQASCLFLLEAPGPRAVKSGFISRNNPDETAKNFFLLNAEAGLPRFDTVSWNIVPWYIGDGIKIRGAKGKDISHGLPYFDKLLGLLPKLRAVVLLGKNAQEVESHVREGRPDLELFLSPHPSPQVVNTNPRNRDIILNVLSDVRKYLNQKTNSNHEEG